MARKTNKKLSKKQLSIDKNNFLIYSIVFTISIIFIGISFIKKESFSTWSALFMSVGASGLCAVVLAYFIERSNNIRMVREKQTIKNKLFSPIIKDIINLLCMESIILKSENDEFRQNMQEKSLVDICHEIVKVYDEELCNDFQNNENDEKIEKAHEKSLLMRQRIVSHLSLFLNYATDDIYYNRSVNIYLGLFEDEEIMNIITIQKMVLKLKESNTYSDYLYQYLLLITNIITDCIQNPLYVKIKEIHWNGEEFVYKDGLVVLLYCRRWFNEDEI